MVVFRIFCKFPVCPTFGTLLEECPISNSRSEAKTGLSKAKAVTEGNGNEYPTEQVGRATDANDTPRDDAFSALAHLGIATPLRSVAVRIRTACLPLVGWEFLAGCWILLAKLRKRLELEPLAKLQNFRHATHAITVCPLRPALLSARNYRTILRVIPGGKALS